MNKVVTINLGGRAYQLEESGYDALRAYLGEASSRLESDPSKSEIIADLEQAIGEKCDRVLTPHKNVISTDEIKKIIDEMGPVEGDNSGEKQSASQTGSVPRRFFLSREGAVFAGVCAGLSKYFDMDALLVRIIFILLTLLTGGIWVVIYIALAVLVPYADTAEARAAASGEVFNAEALVQRAKERWGESYERITGSKWDDLVQGVTNAHDEHRKWREASKQMRNDIRNQRKQLKRDWKAQRYHHRNSATGWFIGALGLLWLLAELSLITSGMLFGWAIPAAIPLWVAVILLFIVFQAVTGPLRASGYRYSYYGDQYHYEYNPWEGFVGVLTGIFVIVALIWAYLQIPQFYFFVHHPIMGIREVGAAIRSWFQR